MAPEPPQTRLFRLAWQLSGRKPKLDAFFSSFLKYRKYLPECNPAEAIPNFDRTKVTFTQAPMGTWSTPLVDVYIIIKAILGFESRRILELGSYRGDTARIIAENTPDDVRLCTVDIDERHGAAYRGTPLERRIERRVGRITPELFDKDEKFDFIFVDADHDYHSVLNDTEVAFSLLSDDGVILWHDYYLDSYFHELNRVPEVLDRMSRQYPIFGITGTSLGFYSRSPGWETATLAERQEDKGGERLSVWEETQIRG